MKILMVCLGNICRSPMAEGILKSKLEKQKIQAIIDSAGFEASQIGDSPDDRAIFTMKKHGLDISKHKMRLFTKEDFDNFDKIYVMDRNNYRDVLALARNKQDISKVDYILNTIEPGKNEELPDPWYGGINGFEYVFQKLDLASDKIVEKLVSKIKNC